MAALFVLQEKELLVPWPEVSRSVFLCLLLASPRLPRRAWRAQNLEGINESASSTHSRGRDVDMVGSTFPDEDDASLFDQTMDVRGCHFDRYGIW